MPKRTTFLIIILAAVAVGLILLAVNSSKSLPPASPTMNVQPTPTKKPVEKTTIIYFAPSVLSSPNASSSPLSADIMVDTGKDVVSGVQIELAYDPKILTNVAIIPTTSKSEGPSLFGPTNGTILFNSVNQAAGRASFAIGLTPSAAPVGGIGKIATLSFYVNKIPGISSTSVSFVNRTMVLKEGGRESVLKTTTPLTIQLVSPTASGSSQ